jgi:hypothetical protein
MREFMISYGVVFNGALGDAKNEDRARRYSDLVMLAFTLGPAWGGNQPATFLKSDLDVDEVTRRFLPYLTHGDLVLVVQIKPERLVRYAGMLSDQEGFEAIFPDALEVN